MQEKISAMHVKKPGLPMAARARPIAELEQKIKKLQAREAELLGSAEKAGLFIGAL